MNLKFEVLKFDPGLNSPEVSLRVLRLGVLECTGVYWSTHKYRSVPQILPHPPPLLQP